MREEILELRGEVVLMITEMIVEVTRSANLSSNVSFVMRKLEDLMHL